MGIFGRIRDFAKKHKLVSGALGGIGRATGNKWLTGGSRLAESFGYRRGGITLAVRKRKGGRISKKRGKK